ncbi:MAG TPA: ABC transporter substrate-binding protein [Candidatus Methylomirabilis sp.]|nr:ABC transporter substrate-binding protein [Candidatus Methylomirabilis sp.]
MRTRGSIICAILGLVVLGIAGSAAWAASGRSGGTLVFVRSADANFLDSGFSTITEDLDVAVNVFDSLVQMDSGGAVKPGLAVSWQNVQGQAWTFKLRSDAKFHDGTPLDSEAVAFSINRLDPESPYYSKGRTSSLRIWLGNLVVRAEALDPTTVKVTLREPYALFPHMLASFPVPIVSPSAVRRSGDGFARQPVGSGPFRFAEWVKDDHITLTANPDYWGGKPNLDQVIFKVVPDASSRLLELKRGSGHFLKGILPDQRAAIEADKGLVLLTRPCSCIGYLAINDQKKPFDDVRVRRALNHAIDRQTIMRTIQGGLGIVAESMYPPWMPGYNARAPKYPYDPPRARELLQQAGFPKGFSAQLWTFNVERPFIPNVLQVAEKVRADLAGVGVDAKISVMDSAVYWRSINTLQGELAMKGWYTPPQPDFLIRVALLGLESATYYPSTPRGQKLREMAVQAARTFDESERSQLYQQIQQMYMEDAPVVPLMHPAYAWVHGSGYTGVEISPDGLTRFYAAGRK